MVVCLERSADLHMAQLMLLPLTVFCFSKIQIGFTILVPAHLGSPGQRAVKRVCVCVCVMLCFRLRNVRGVFIYGKPEVSVVAFGSNDFNIYRLSDALAACGWNLNALQFPSR